MSYNILALQTSSDKQVNHFPQFYSSVINDKKERFIPTISHIISSIDELFKPYLQTDDKYIFISQISENLYLQNPIELLIKKEEGYYTVEYKICNLIIEAVGETYKEMVQDFKDQLVDAWDYYSDEDDQNLTRGAIEVKRWLREHIIEE